MLTLPDLSPVTLLPYRPLGSGFSWPALPLAPKSRSSFPGPLLKDGCQLPGLRGGGGTPEPYWWPPSPQSAGDKETKAEVGKVEFHPLWEACGGYIFRMGEGRRYF